MIYVAAVKYAVMRLCDASASSLSCAAAVVANSDTAVAAEIDARSDERSSGSILRKLALVVKTLSLFWFVWYWFVCVSYPEEFLLMLF